MYVSFMFKPISVILKFICLMPDDRKIGSVIKIIDHVSLLGNFSFVKPYS